MAAVVLSSLGGFFSLCGDVARAVFKRPFQWREFLDQTVFISSVSTLPVVFVTIPFTVVVQFFIGQLLTELGANDLAGAGAGLAVIRELGPFASVLVVAGAGATSVCADLGSRKIREEIDAMAVLGVDPIHRLVVPRVVAFILVSTLLFGLTSVVGLLGSYLFAVLVQGVSPGLFVANLTLLTGFTDFVVSTLKAAVFGLAAALVACSLGLNAKGGPKGVGQAVNQTVVFTLMLLLVINTLVTSMYFQLKG